MDHSAEQKPSDHLCVAEGAEMSPAAVRARTEATEATGRRPCRYAGGPLPATARNDATCCSDRHRNAYNRERTRREAAERRPLQDAAQALERFGELAATITDQAAQIRQVVTGVNDTVVADAEAARAETRAARRAADEADNRVRLAEARAEQDREDAAGAAQDKRAAEAAAADAKRTAAIDVAAEKKRADGYLKELGAARAELNTAITNRRHAEQAHAAISEELEQSRDEVTRLRATLAERDTQLRDTTGQLTAAHAELATTTANLREAATRLEAARDDIQRLTDTAARHAATADDLRRRLEQATIQLTETRERLTTLQATHQATVESLTRGCDQARAAADRQRERAVAAESELRQRDAELQKLRRAAAAPDDTAAAPATDDPPPPAQER